MKLQHLFPLALIILNVGAAIIYLLKSDIKMTVYYTAAAVLNITVIL